MKTIRELLAVFGILALIAVGAVTLNHFIEPLPVRAASQMANIICDNFVPVSAAIDTQVITAGNANMFIYVCSYNLGAGVADNFSMVEGTGTVCATNIKAMVGGTTAATGIQFTAVTGGAINYGGGSGAVAKTAVAGDNVCILRSTAGPLAGVIGWTTAPY